VLPLAVSAILPALQTGYNAMMILVLFLLLPVALYLAAAFQAGRAIAQTWRPWWQVVLYMLILGAVAQFFVFVVFQGPFLSLLGYALDTAVAIGCATLGFRIARARQMARQYGFLGPAT
jgi:hypothetical protein